MDEKKPKEIQAAGTCTYIILTESLCLQSSGDSIRASVKPIEKITINNSNTYFGALDVMGLIFIHQGQFQQAIDVYDKMLEIFPFSVKTMDKKERIQSFISQST